MFGSILTKVAVVLDTAIRRNELAKSLLGKHHEPIGKRIDKVCEVLYGFAFGDSAARERRKQTGTLDLSPEELVECMAAAQLSWNQLAPIARSVALRDLLICGKMSGMLWQPSLKRPQRASRDMN